MNNIKIDTLVAMITELAFVPPPAPERRFLLNHGWIPFGQNSVTGLEGWGKMINDEESVIVDQPEALALEGWQADVGGGAR